MDRKLESGVAAPVQSQGQRLVQGVGGVARARLTHEAQVAVVVDREEALGLLVRRHEAGVNPVELSAPKNGHERHVHPVVAERLAAHGIQGDHLAQVRPGGGQQGHAEAHALAQFLVHGEKFRWAAHDVDVERGVVDDVVIAQGDGLEREGLGQREFQANGWLPAGPGLVAVFLSCHGQWFSFVWGLRQSPRVFRRMIVPWGEFERKIVGAVFTGLSK